MGVETAYLTACHALDQHLDSGISRGEGRKFTFLDYQHQTRCLAEALRLRRPEVLTAYLAWAKVLLEKHDVPGEALTEEVTRLRATLSGTIETEAYEAMDGYLRDGLRYLAQTSGDLPSFIDTAGPHAELLQGYIDALMRGERKTASRMILDAVEGGVEVREIYLHVFQKAQYEVGRLWQLNRITVGQEHYCTAATQSIMSQLYPKVFSSPRNGMRMVATCVGGDLHELGLRMISDFFEMDGWDTFYLGANTPTDSIVAAVVERRADLVTISATMSYHLGAVVELIREIRLSPAGAAVRVMVGGYPFNNISGLWRTVGADAYARDALEAGQIGRDLVESKRDNEVSR